MMLLKNNGCLRLLVPGRSPARPPSPRLDRNVTADNKLAYALPMTNKRLRAIAALEVELAMTEAHAKKLSAVPPDLDDPERRHAMAALVKEENDRAEILRRRIHLLRVQI